LAFRLRADRSQIDAMLTTPQQSPLAYSDDLKRQLFDKFFRGVFWDSNRNYFVVATVSSVHRLRYSTVDSKDRELDTELEPHFIVQGDLIEAIYVPQF
jgi:hypothetical protein